MFWTCFGVLFSEISFLQCVPWRVESSKCFQKIKKIPKFQKCPKSFPKVSKRVLNDIWGNFFEKFFMPSVAWRVESSKCFLKFFKIQKTPKIVPKLSKRVLNMFWGNFFEKIFCPVFHGRSSLRKVFKKFSKFQKRPKLFPNCPNVFWTIFGVIFSKKSLPRVPWSVESSKCF